MTARAQRVERIGDKLAEAAQRAHRERIAGVGSGRTEVQRDIDADRSSGATQTAADPGYADSDARLDYLRELRDERLGEERMREDERRALRL